MSNFFSIGLPFDDKSVILQDRKERERERDTQTHKFLTSNAL